MSSELCEAQQSINTLLRLSESSSTRGIRLRQKEKEEALEVDGWWCTGQYAISRAN
jgi:hypothetical protein